jgi:hypothetical protein
MTDQLSSCKSCNWQCRHPHHLPGNNTAKDHSASIEEAKKIIQEKHQGRDPVMESVQALALVPGSVREQAQGLAQAEAPEPVLVVAWVPVPESAPELELVLELVLDQGLESELVTVLEPETAQAPETARALGEEPESALERALAEQLVREVERVEDRVSGE